MFEMSRITIIGIFRDRVFQGIIGLAILFLFIPSAASFSMRQVTELAITLSLSLISAILLLLAVFLGATSIWKEIERRYSYSVLSLPLSRPSFLLGRFLGIALFMALTALVLGVAACLSIMFASIMYPPTRPIAWHIIVVSIGFDALKYILLVAIAMTLSTVSTSFFLPIFGSISAFLTGTISQQVYDFIRSSVAENTFSPFMKKCVMILYYILPNLAGFDLKVNAIYALPLNGNGVLLTVAYFVVYLAIVLSLSMLFFERREI
ncbi:membrane protein [Geobacter pickeringii]|uniref:Membrane protein n=1 Tax=Geobacter pickeringii TaxID=345632 RepID=A0A0B5B9L7_9BACT|nr:membrane protein [Geobacter pickeringii]AJE03398.1 membrane protein [Geobacter pickeringii]